MFCVLPVYESSRHCYSYVQLGCIMVVSLLGWIPMYMTDA